MKYIGVTPQRLSKGLIDREFVPRKDMPFMRQKARPILTPFTQRLKAHPRKLTRLDKALTDLEAYSLDRAFEAWLMTSGKSHSVDCSGSGVRGNEQAEPLNQSQLGEVGKLNKVIACWQAWQRRELEIVFGIMAPWNELYGQKPGKLLIQNIAEYARLLQPIYFGDFKAIA